MLMMFFSIGNGPVMVKGVGPRISRVLAVALFKEGEHNDV